MLATDLEYWQKACKKRALKHDGFLVYHVQGTGKTLTSLSIVLERYKNDGVRRVLVVGPLSAIDVWEQDLKKYCKIQYKVIPLEQCNRRERLQMKRIPKFKNKLTFVTINYESLVKRRRSKNKGQSRRICHIFKLVKAWKPEFIVADESHKIKSRKTAQTKSLWELGDGAKYKLCCSGTPVEQSAIDLWAQFRFACPEVLGTNFSSFKNTYCRESGYGYSKLVMRKRMSKQLLPILHSRMDRVTKDVLNLPDIKYIKKRFSLPDQAQSQYDSMLKEAVVEIDETQFIASPNVLAKMVRLQQITSGYLPDQENDGELHELHNAKIRALEQVIKKRKGQKIVIFARFVPEIHSILDLCQDLKMRPVCIYGKIKGPERKAARLRFLKDPMTLAFVAQVRTGGVGINELRVAKTGVFYSSTFSWIDYDQAVARLHRRGQKNPVDIVNVIARGTIDEDLFNSLGDKKDIAKFILSVRKRYHG